MEKSIVLSETYMQSYDKFDRQTRKMILQSVKMFAKGEKGNGFQVHDLQKARDKSFKSARINDDLRLIFSQQGKQYIFLYVDRHDQAYNWAEGRTLDKSSFGALFINQDNIVPQQPKDNVIQFVSSYTDNEPLLCKHQITVKELMKLGIVQVHAENLIKLSNEDDFIDYISIFPDELQEALLNLAGGAKTITEVYADLEDERLSHNNESTIEEALAHKDSKRRFYVVQNLGELEEILENSPERWQLFLHPKQEDLVTKNFNGPVLIEGGPGTGKTILGIHRAVHLANEVYPASKGHRLLFCTFSRKLCSLIENKLEVLMNQKKVHNNVDLKGVDQIFAALCYQYKLSDGELNPNGIIKLLEETVHELNPSEPLSFYKAEWEEIIQKYRIISSEEYLLVNRQGTGNALNPSQRKKVWDVFEVFLKRKREMNLINYEDRAFFVYQALKQKRIAPIYDSIIIDEAQDLSANKMKALSMLVKSQKNNLFILSDQNQRIYSLGTWRKDTGIEIVGRTYYLSINYRTTKQIREYADRQFVKTKMVKDHIREYKSLLHGPEPEIKQFQTKQKQYNFIVERLKQLIRPSMVQLHEICIISPNDRNEIAGILQYEGIRSTVLEHDLYPSEQTGVCICSLQGSKGLEFRSVLLVNYTDIGSDLWQLDQSDWYTEMKINHYVQETLNSIYS